jgi:hypothetical protein
MALTLTRVSGPTQVGDGWRNIWAAAADTSYPTGGWPLSKASLGFAATTDPQFNVQAENAGGYMLEYDHTNSKLKAYRQTAATGALVEVPNTTDVSAAITAARIVAQGKFGL